MKAVSARHRVIVFVIVTAQPPTASITVTASPMLAKTPLMACPLAPDGQHCHHEVPKMRRETRRKRTTWFCSSLWCHNRLTHAVLRKQARLLLKLAKRADAPPYTSGAAEKFFV